MMQLTLASLILTLVPGSIQEAPDTTRHWWDSFPVVKGDLTLGLGEDGSHLSMMALANEYAELTDQHLVISPETRQLLESARSGTHASVVVPRDHVQAFFETLLIENQFVLHLLRQDAPRMLAIESLQTQQRNTVRRDARFVSREHIEALRDHPAMLITTTLELPFTDVRLLSNSMRSMITDANTQQMLPAGNSNSLVLTGFGPGIADMITMLEQVDARSKVSWEQNYERRKLEQTEPESEAAEATDTTEAPQAPGK